MSMQPQPSPQPVERDLLQAPGDADALHVIREPGLYALHAHIRGVRGKRGVRVDADNVTIDLHGHTLIGCEFSRDGIAVSDTAANVRVRNGSVRSWGGVGIDLANAINSDLLNVKIFDNARGAVRLGAGAVLTDCVVGGDLRSGVPSFARSA